ncbi:MAG TPA: nickel pincer cofactor biosynthesis protein LarC [Anaerolineaceae bacterium]|nr:nickel pincer cofactor biosynthesis protein LarC [Anaerolineaceae bacterium]
MSILYCDCFSGISGDMFLGALLDAGMPASHLADQFNKLNLPEFESVSVAQVHKGTLAAALLNLAIRPETDPAEPARHPISRTHHHHHRHLCDIQDLIQTAQLPEPVKEISLKIFHKLAQAEARVHGTSVEAVHFHEVGAVDSILDIVGAAVGLHYFQITAVYASALPLGTGQVNTEHGCLPLPAPATLELLRLAQAPLTPSPAKLELVTPTGAAILAALATFEQPGIRLTRVGIGAGRRELAWPNVLRLLIGEADVHPGSHLEIETNIDDQNPQILGHVLTRLFQAGALDVYFTPIYMKKNRPATKLSVIARREDEAALCDLILRETSTLGLRVTPIWRHEAGREIRHITTRYGEIPVKLKIINGQIIQAAPEYDACVQLAEKTGLPLTQILQAATAAGQALIS